MKKQQLFQLSIVVVTAIFTVGCAKEGASVEAPKVVQKESSSQPTVSSGLTLATLQSSSVSNLTLTGTKAYKEKEPIEFTVDTKGKAGYLYIIYLDNKGETQLLYPNSMSPLTELSGKYTFPRDFGGMSINATKDCNGCSEDKTTIYAILTKEPVSDIEGITKSHLLKFAGVKSSKSQSKGLNMSVGGSTPVSGNNINVGQIDFVVR